MGSSPSFSCGVCEASVLPAIDSIEPYIFNGFCVVFWRLFNQHDKIAENFQKTVSSGARSQHPLLIEWETFACGFENQSKTSVFCHGVLGGIPFPHGNIPKNILGGFTIRIIASRAP
jgi:hypothetical protein